MVAAQDPAPAPDYAGDIDKMVVPDTCAKVEEYIVNEIGKCANTVTDYLKNNGMSDSDASDETRNLVWSLASKYNKEAHAINFCRLENKEPNSKRGVDLITTTCNQMMTDTKKKYPPKSA